MARLRLFVGISAPEKWRLEMMAWRRDVQSNFSRTFGRWTEQNLHVTLRFFGSVEENDVDAISRALQKAAEGATPFELCAGAFGCFPNADHPRILWLGLRGETPELQKLEARIRAETMHFGQAPEDRPFHPHLTIARLGNPTRNDRDNLQSLIKESKLPTLPAWRVTELELICSELRPGGSVYTQLASIPLL